MINSILLLYCFIWNLFRLSFRSHFVSISNSITYHGIILFISFSVQVHFRIVGFRLFIVVSNTSFKLCFFLLIYFFFKFSVYIYIFDFSSLIIWFCFQFFISISRDKVEMIDLFTKNFLWKREADSFHSLNNCILNWNLNRKIHWLFSDFRNLTYKLLKCGPQFH